MRVLLLSPHYPPDVAATGQLVADLAEDMAGAGHQPVVIAARPGQTAGAADFRPPRVERRNGVEIHWLAVPRTGRRGVWSRLLPFTGYFFAATLRAARLRGIDVVFAQSTPPLLAGLLAALLGTLPGRRFVYNLQDVYPDLGQALGVLGDGPLTRLSRWVESRLRRRADRLIVLSDDMRRAVLRRDPALGNIAVIGNWADCERIVPVAAADNPFRRDHGLAGRFVVQYSGNLGRVHGVEVLPEVARRLADLDDLVLLVIGDGPARAAMEAAAGDARLKNLRWLPFQTRERLSLSLGAADVALILQREAVGGLVVPSKLYGILASGRPTVAAVPRDGEVARVLQTEEAGVVVEPGCAREIAEAVRELYLNRRRAERMGARARQAALARYDRRQATGRYIKLFTQLESS